MSVGNSDGGNSYIEGVSPRPLARRGSVFAGGHQVAWKDAAGRVFAFPVDGGPRPIITVVDSIHKGSILGNWILDVGGKTWKKLDRPARGWDGNTFARDRVWPLEVGVTKRSDYLTWEGATRMDDSNNRNTLGEGGLTLPTEGLEVLVPWGLYRANNKKVSIPDVCKVPKSRLVAACTFSGVDLIATSTGIYRLDTGEQLVSIPIGDYCFSADGAKGVGSGNIPKSKMGSLSSLDSYYWFPYMGDGVIRHEFEAKPGPDGVIISLVKNSIEYIEHNGFAGRMVSVAYVGMSERIVIEAPDAPLSVTEPDKGVSPAPKLTHLSQMRKLFLEPHRRNVNMVRINIVDGVKQESGSSSAYKSEALAFPSAPYSPVYGPDPGTLVGWDRELLTEEYVINDPSVTYKFHMKFGVYPPGWETVWTQTFGGTGSYDIAVSHSGCFKAYDGEPMGYSTNGFPRYPRDRKWRIIERASAQVGSQAGDGSRTSAQNYFDVIATGGAMHRTGVPGLIGLHDERPEEVKDYTPGPRIKAPLSVITHDIYKDGYGYITHDYQVQLGGSYGFVELTELDSYDPCSGEGVKYTYKSEQNIPPSQSAYSGSMSYSRYGNMYAPGQVDYPHRRFVDHQKYASVKIESAKYNPPARSVRGAIPSLYYSTGAYGVGLSDLRFVNVTRGLGGRLYLDDYRTTFYTMSYGSSKTLHTPLGVFMYEIITDRVGIEEFGDKLCFDSDSADEVEAYSPLTYTEQITGEVRVPRVPTEVKYCGVHSSDPKAPIPDIDQGLLPKKGAITPEGLKPNIVLMGYI